MLTRHRSRIVEGRIRFDYDRLPVTIGELSGTIAGTAHIAYDGRGAWWPEQVEVSNPRHPGPQVFLAVIDPLFDEIAGRLDRHRGEDIEERIAQAIIRVAPITLAQAQRHREVEQVARDGASARIGAGRFNAFGSSLRAAAQFGAMAAELACIFTFVAGALCWSLPETAPHAAQARHGAAVVAKLEMPGDRH